MFRFASKWFWALSVLGSLAVVVGVFANDNAVAKVGTAVLVVALVGDLGVRWRRRRAAHARS